MVNVHCCAITGCTRITLSSKLSVFSELHEGPLLVLPDSDTGEIDAWSNNFDIGVPYSLKSGTEAGTLTPAGTGWPGSFTKNMTPAESNPPIRTIHLNTRFIRDFPESYFTTAVSTSFQNNAMKKTQFEVYGDHIVLIRGRLPGRREGPLRGELGRLQPM
jgi:hypothetical protein